MQWQFVSKWQILHSLDVQKHKSSSEFVTGWRTPFDIVGHFALLKWLISAYWKEARLCPPQFPLQLCLDVCRLASVYSWTSKSRAPCANIFWAPVEINNMQHNGEALWRRGQEEASLQIARWWDWGLLWLERKHSPTVWNYMCTTKTATQTTSYIPDL